MGLVCLVAYIVIPKLGLPSSRYILIKRIERLGKWKQATICYIQDNNKVPDSLFEVYKYCNENKKGIDLRLASLPIASIEDNLLKKKETILIDKNIFNGNIEYEFIAKDEIWQIRERKTYPKYFREKLAIDSRGNVLVYSLE